VSLTWTRLLYVKHLHFLFGVFIYIYIYIYFFFFGVICIKSADTLAIKLTSTSDEQFTSAQQQQRPLVDLPIHWLE